MIRHRRRLKKAEIAILEKEFQKNSDWNYDYQHELGEKLGFSRVKIYKWHYDRLKKAMADGEI